MTLKHFSIADIAHHDDINSVTGKVHFQFADFTDGRRGLDQFVVLDISVPASDNVTIAEIKRAMVSKAMAILSTALGEAEAGPLLHQPSVPVTSKVH